MGSKQNILIVDNDSSVIDAFKYILKETYAVDAVVTGEAALDKIKYGTYDLILLASILPGIDGIEVLRKVKMQNQDQEIIMVTAVHNLKITIESMKLGAFSYFIKPFDMDEVQVIIREVFKKIAMKKQIAYLQSTIKDFGEVETLLGDTPTIRSAQEIINEMQKTDSTVLISGEEGAGKTTVAMGIHFKGKRHENPFVVVNCGAATTESLEESLFGVVDNAGNVLTGKIESAHKGTLFLKEVGLLSRELQKKLLNAMRRKEIVRMGDDKVIPVDIRYIASTSQNLKDAVKKDGFREDLFYHLNIVSIPLDALQDRRKDIALLVNYFIGEVNRKHNRSVQGVTPRAMEYLAGYNWPGNVRELQNVTERLVFLCTEDEINEYILPIEIIIDFKVNLNMLNNADTAYDISLKDVRHNVEKKMLVRLLEKYRGNQSKVSRILNVHRNTVINKVREFGIKPSAYRGWNRKK